MSTASPIRFWVNVSRVGFSAYWTQDVALDALDLHRMAVAARAFEAGARTWCDSRRKGGRLHRRHDEFFGRWWGWWQHIGAAETRPLKQLARSAFSAGVESEAEPDRLWARCDPEFGRPKPKP